MAEPTTTVAAKLLADAAPLAIGSAIALKFNTADLAFTGRAFAFVASLAIGHYIGGALIERAAIDPGMLADGVKLATSLFGLSFAASITAEIPQLVTAMVAAIRRKFLGDSE